MQKKKIVFIVSVLAVSLAVFVIYLWPDFFSEEMKTVYTVKDFPQALERMDQARLESKVDELNNLYQLLLAGDKVYARWIDIGVIKNSLGDVGGAEEAWQKAIEKNPSSILAFGNLGNLYMYDLKDNEKAETYYKRALELDKQHYTFYHELATLYRYRIPEKAHLIEGLMNECASKASRQAVTCFSYLADYFADTSENGGNNEQKAKTYQQKAEEAGQNQAE